ncbi:MAG: type II toxin-antitoxin system PemK/MazF family toxin [Bacteroidetes bacterium]|nr:type II toxin-antitoxin system PemK/MazF family toxin [Bacteroidota bacterium]
MDYKRFEVYLVSLNPTVGRKIKKTRPCVIISPDEVNRNIAIVIIAPLTSKLRNYPTRIPSRVKGKHGQIILDQIRTVDKIRLIKKIDFLNKTVQTKTLTVLNEMFSK